ncbi:hypothetical protein SAMN05444380_10339 [Thermophagus xiamenensis]|uniref:Transposase, Mutator family n=1 Tax=Thermophagus xiamenensis TaxID=385682 RepID=A0A1I1VSM9_9BACT|nr:hypothetical protein [Thermophagus xiamenensis]SFD85769.1 hypothetical protein SAMN05444380_10339 [Thermophagus xiamenensis]
MADKKKETPEYRALCNLALEKLHRGKSLSGEGGVLEPIIKEFLGSALSAEMENHYLEEERSFGNKPGKESNQNKRSIYLRIWHF